MVPQRSNVVEASSFTHAKKDFMTKNNEFSSGILMTLEVTRDSRYCFGMKASDIDAKQFPVLAHLVKAHEDEAHAKTDLGLYIENTAELYPQKQAIIENLKKKIASGEYSPDLAAKAWLHWVDAGAKQYAKELGSEESKSFTPKIKQEIAKELADYYEQAIKNGEYDKTESAVVLPLTPEQQKYLAKAKELYDEEGSIEVDESAELPTSVVSESEEGAYVMAWVWVSKDLIE